MAAGPSNRERLKALGERADLALRSGRYEEAHALASEALRLAPNLAPALAARASAAARLRNYEHAERDITRALRAVPDAPPGWKVTLALIRRGQDRLDEAIEILRAEHAASPDAQIVTSNLAELLATTRRHDDAHALLVAALERGADRPGLLAQFGRVCRTLGRPEDAVDRLRACLERTDLTVSGRKQAAFELGHVLDRMGEHDEAFAAFTEGNRLESRRFDMTRHGQLIDRVCRDWTAEALAAVAPNEGAGDGCALIVGMRRSGTTLAEQILSAHPRVRAGGELRWLREAAMPIDPQPMREFSIAAAISGLTAEAARSAGDTYAGRIDTIREGAALVTDKMPANYKLLGIASRALPLARVVWCRRDPLDVCLSCFMQPFNDNSYCRDLRVLARYYHDCERLMAHWAGALPRAPHQLRYESLVEDPDTQTRALTDAVGVEFDEACLRFHESDRAARTASTDQVARKLYASSVGRWRSYERHLGPLTDELQRLGHHL